MASDRDWIQCEELIDACMEWIGRHWTKSMIKRQIRLIADNKKLADGTCLSIINKAYAKIRKLYSINPEEFKGIQIEFYRAVIRRQGEKTKDQITAAERLDKLFGLETISGADPEELARKARDALIGMEASIGRPGDVEEQEQESQGRDSNDDGNSKVDAEHSSESNGEQSQDGQGRPADSVGGHSKVDSIGSSNSKPEQERVGPDQNTSAIDLRPISEDKDITEEMAEEIGSITDEEWAKFRKDNNIGL